MALGQVFFRMAKGQYPLSTQAVAHAKYIYIIHRVVTGIDVDITIKQVPGVLYNSNL